MAFTEICDIFLAKKGLDFIVPRTKKWAAAQLPAFFHIATYYIYQ
ncbi:hypothetical protein [uncultured Gemmiger sp.]|nr:hypothetical protein [uncultured Gemmiger sp.]